MRLLEPLAPPGEAGLARANPVAKLAAASIVMVALFLSVDLVTSGLLLAAVVVAVVVGRLSIPALLSRAWPIGVAALSVGAINALLAGDAANGEALFSFGPLRLTAASGLAGLAVAARLLGIALAGLLALATTDPTDLADALVQQLRLPWRYAVGTLAALRLLPVFGTEWQLIGLARRARGVEAGRSPVAALRLFGERTHAFLVGAIRRGIGLATAMDARGFGSAACRTSARTARMQRADWLLILLAALVAAAATAVSLAVGSWRFVLG